MGFRSALEDTEPIANEAPGMQRVTVSKNPRENVHLVTRWLAYFSSNHVGNDRLSGNVFRYDRFFPIVLLVL